MFRHLKPHASNSRPLLQLEALEDRCLLSTTPLVLTQADPPTISEAQKQLIADIGTTVQDYQQTLLDAAEVSDAMQVATGAVVAVATGATSSDFVIQLLTSVQPFISNSQVATVFHNFSHQVEEGDSVAELLPTLQFLYAVSFSAIAQDVSRLNTDITFLFHDLEALTAAEVAAALGQPSGTQDQIAIQDFSISPSSPKQGDVVTATAWIINAPVGTVVELTVQESTGFSFTTSKTIAGNDSISTTITGLKGDTDTVTLSVPGLPSRQITFTFG